MECPDDEGVGRGEKKCLARVGFLGSKGSRMGGARSTTAADLGGIRCINWAKDEHYVQLCCCG